MDDDKLDAILEKLDRCSKVKIQFPDLEFVRGLPEYIRTEIDMLRQSVSDEVRRVIDDVIKHPEHAPFFSEVRRVVDDVKPVVEAVENKVMTIASQVGTYVLIVRLILLGIVLCLLVDLATNVALLTNRETLWISLPLVGLVVVVLFLATRGRSMQHERPKRRAREPRMGAQRVRATPPPTSSVVSVGSGGAWSPYRGTVVSDC